MPACMSLSFPFMEASISAWCYVWKAQVKFSVTKKNNTHLLQYENVNMRNITVIIST